MTTPDMKPLLPEWKFVEKWNSQGGDFCRINGNFVSENGARIASLGSREIEAILNVLNHRPTPQPSSEYVKAVEAAKQAAPALNDLLHSHKRMAAGFPEPYEQRKIIEEMADIALQDLNKALAALKSLSAERPE